MLSPAFVILIALGCSHGADGHGEKPFSNELSPEHEKTLKRTKDHAGMLSIPAEVQSVALKYVTDKKEEEKKPKIAPSSAYGKKERGKD
jgi:hypothetical protein